MIPVESPEAVRSRASVTSRSNRAAYSSSAVGRPVAGGLEPKPRSVPAPSRHRRRPGDVGPQSGEGIGGRVVAPHGGDQPVDRDHGVPMQQQHGQQGTRLGAADRDGNAAGRDLERSQDPELHRGPHSGRRLGRLQPGCNPPRRE